MLRKIILLYAVLAFVSITFAYTWPPEKQMPGLTPDALAWMNISIFSGGSSGEEGTYVYSNDASLEALYRFELSGADIGDDTTGTYDLAQNNGGPDRVAGDPSQGDYHASFNSGDSEYLSGSPISAIGAHDFTICFWLSNDSSASGPAIDITEGTTGHGLIFNADGSNHLQVNFFASWSSDSTVSTSTLGTTTWHHWCVVYDYDTVGNDTFIYLDGNQTPDKSDDLTVIPNTGMTFTRLGRQQSTYMGGDFDEVAIFSRMLSTEEIASIYTNGIIDP